MIVDTNKSTLGGRVGLKKMLKISVDPNAILTLYAVHGDAAVSLYFDGLRDEVLSQIGMLESKGVLDEFKEKIREELRRAAVGS